ncbi:MAG TPA: response regulator [Thermoanaerobaculia bacterium]|nr:response regulator [Thermoanaerobaculia bacterium]
MLEAPVRRAEFLPEAWSIACGIEEAVRGVTSPEAPAAERLLRVLTHRMAGSASLFGMTEVARVADAMEGAAERLGAGDGERSQALDLLAGMLPVLTRLLDEESVRPADPLAVELAELARHEGEALADFLPELAEHLEEAGEALVRMAASGPSAGDLAALFRRMHTIKGTAFVVGCRPVGELAHRVEDALAVARAEPARFDGAAVRAGFAALDVLHEMAAVLSGRRPAHPLTDARDAVLRDLALWAASAPAAPPEPAPAPPVPRVAEEEPKAAPLGLRFELQAVDGLLELTGDLLVLRNRLERDVERAEALRTERRASAERLRRTLRELADRFSGPRPAAALAVSAASAGSAASGPGAALSDLELDRYDDFTVLARRLEEIADDLLEVEAQEGALTGDLRTGAEGLKTLAEGLHTGVGRLRLVPLGQVFGRSGRLARRAAAAAGKLLDLEVTGERVEVDAAIAERIWDPLLHLVQNAVDHGLEPAAARLARGKPAAGRLRLAARAEGRRVVVEVEDDGAGIDLDRVRRRAAELGLAPAASELGDPEALRLVFLPGLTTAAVPTARSGRGVGLDVVRSTLERLGGSVEAASTPGGGTRFRLVFPLTLVVSEVLLVRVGDQTVAVPATAVERIAEAAPDAVEVGEERAPVVDLAQVLGLPSRSDGPAPVLVVGAPGRFRGLRVDEVLRAETVALRPLGPFFEDFGLFSGGLLTREGTLVLLVNVAACTEGAAASCAAPRAAPPAVRPVRVLLADDSVSVRKILGRMLARAGYDVTPAVDGEEARERLEEGAYDVLVTDLEMPRLNGYELIDWIRGRPATADLPVIVVTTRVDEKHRELARGHGATAYLPKPTQESVLLQTVAGVSAGRKEPM